VFGNTQASTSLCHNFLRVLNLINEVIHTEATKVDQDQQEVVFSEASCQTDVKEFWNQDPNYKALLQKHK